MEVAHIHYYCPDAFYGVEDDPTLHGVDVMTDVSMAPTAFTRYTAAPTAISKASKYATLVILLDSFSHASVLFPSIQTFIPIKAKDGAKDWIW